MNRRELDSLIELYFNAESSKEEEARLIEILGEAELPEDYYPERDMLLDINAGGDNIPEPDSKFEDRIMQAIDKSDKAKKVISLKRRIYTVVSVAASLLILITTVLMLNRNTEPADTYDDPMLAYNATIELLQEVSLTMNTGSEAISDLLLIAETKEKLSRLSEPARKASRDMEALKYIEQSLLILRKGGVLGPQETN